MRYSKLSVVVAVVVTLAVNAFAGGPPKATTTKAGTVSALLPVAHIQRGAGKAAVVTDAKKGDDVMWEDLLRTEKGGRARLTLNDGSILSLGSQAELRVVKQDAASQQTSLELQYGRVRAEVNKITQVGGSFTVKTPTAVAGVIGTEFATESGVSSTEFVCLSGNVSIGSSDPTIHDKVNCLAGQVVRVEKGKAPTQPVAASPQQLQKVIQDTEPGVISAMTPSLLGPGMTVDVTVTGAHLENLTNASISGTGVQVSISSAATAGSLTLHVVAAADAPSGVRTVTLSGTNPTPTVGAIQVVSGLTYPQLMAAELQSSVGGLNGLLVGLQQTEQLALQQLQTSGIKTVDLIGLKSKMDAQVKIVADAVTTAVSGDKTAEDGALTQFGTLTGNNTPAADAYGQVNPPMLGTFVTNQQNVGRLLQTASDTIASELSDELKILGIQAGGLGLLGELQTDIGNTVTIEATGKASNGTNYNWSLCAAGTGGNCTAIAGQTAASNNFAVDTCSLQPGDYRANLNFTTAAGTPTSALYLLHVLPDNTPQPIDVLRGLSNAYMSLQSQQVMTYFDQTAFSNYTQLQENVRKSFAELSSMTINVIPLSTDTKCNSASMRASWNQNYSFRNASSMVFQQSEQLTVRMQRTPGKGWLITELQGDNGTLQGNPPGPVGSGDEGAKPDLKVSDISADSITVTGARGLRPNGQFPGLNGALTPGKRTYHVVFTNTSQITLNQSVQVVVNIVDASGAIIATGTGLVVPPLAPGASETVDITVDIPSSVLGQQVQLQVIVNPGCSSVIQTCNGVVTDTQTVGVIDLAISGLAPVGVIGPGLPGSFTASVRNQGTLASQGTTATLTSDLGGVSGTASVGPLAPGGSTTVTFNVNIPAGSGAHTLTVSIVPPQFDNNASNNSASTQITLNPVPVVTVGGGPFTYDGTAHSATCSAASSTGTPVAGNCSFTYNGGSSAPVNAGSYAVTAVFTSSNPNFSNAVGTGSITISKRTPAVTVTGGIFAFDNSPHASVCTATGLNNAPVAGSCAVSYNGAAAVPVKPGTYGVAAAFTSSDPNYTDGSATATLTIKGSFTPLITISGGPFTFDGNPHAAVCSAFGTNNVAVPGTCDLTYGGSPSAPVNAGTYGVAAKFTSADPNYTDSTGNGSLTINKATPLIAVNGGPFTFDGSPHQATCTATGVGGAPVNGTCALTYNNSPNAPTNAGTYSVGATFTSNNANYANANGSGVLVITPAGTPTLQITGGPFTYDGNPHQATCVALGTANIVVNGTCALTYAGSPNPPVNAGSYNVTAVFTSADPRFSNANGGGSLTINKAIPTVTVSGGPFAFSGSPHSASCSATGVGGASVSGSCTFTYNGSSTAPSAAGNYNVVANFVSSNLNYANTTGSGTMVITSAGIPTIVVSGGPFTYDGNSHGATCTVTGAGNAPVAGTCALTYNGSPAAPTNAGTYPVAAAFTSSDPNYSNGNGSGSITINKATPVVSVTGGPFTFDGNTHSSTCTVTGVNNATVSGTCSLTYNGSSTVPSAAGSYNVTATFTSADGNYNNATGGGTLVIGSAGAPTITVTGGPFTFDGNSHSATCAATGTNNSVVAGACALTYNGSSTAPTNAGTYAVVASFTSSDPNYSNGTGGGTLVINQATPTVTVSGGPFTFDGNPHSSTCSATGVGGAPVSGTCSLTYNSSATAPTAAGTYTVAATFTSSNTNYTNATGSGTLVINGAGAPTITVTGGPFTFDGNSHSATCAATGTNNSVVAGTCALTYNGSSTAPTNAGTYAVVATFTSSDPNYSNGGGSGSIVINQAAPTVSASGGPFTFDGTQHSASCSATGVGGAPVSGSCSFTYNGSPTAPTNAGTYTVAVSFTSGNANYSNATGSGSIAINKATPTVSVSGGPFAFDGNAHSSTCSATGVGNAPVSGSCSLTYNGSSTAPSAAGSYTVVASFTSSDGNYNNATGGGTLVINGAGTPTISISGGPFTFDGNPHSSTCTVTGVGNAPVAGTCSLTYNGSSTPPTNANTYPVVATFTSSDPNYSNGTANGSLVIHQATPTVTVSGGPFNFDGTQHSSTCSATGVGGAPVSGTCSLTYNGSSTAPTNAGTYTVAATFTSSNANYTNATGSGSLVINAAGTPTITITGGPFNYDGLQHSATCSATGVGNAPVAGTCTLTYNGSPTAPTGAGTYTVAATFTSSDPNYGNTTGSGSLTINKVGLQITASSTSVVFGSPVPTITPSFSGFVNGETSAVLSGQPGCGSGYTTTTNVGTAVVSACAGAAAANYTISYVPGSVTITQAQTTIAVVADNSSISSGATVTFTATLSVTAPGSGTPSGTVTFKDGATTIGTGTVSGGTASFATSTLSVGSHTITAVYGGDTNFGGSTSTGITESVVAAAIDFVPTILRLSNGSSIVQIGETGLNATVTIANNSNRNNGSFTISFACGAGGPSGSLVSAPIPPAGSSSVYSVPLTTTGLTTGSYSCTVSLSSLPGGTNASTLSGPVTVVDFTFTTFAATANMISGRTASFTGLTASPSNYPLTLALTFGGLPPGINPSSSGLTTTFSGTAGAAGTGTISISINVSGHPLATPRAASIPWQILADLIASQQGNTVVTLVPPNCVARTPLNLLVTTQLPATATLGTLPSGLSTSDPNPVSLAANASQQTVAWELDVAQTTILGDYTANATVTDAGISATNTPGKTVTTVMNLHVVGAGICSNAQILTGVGFDSASVNYSPSLPKAGDTVDVRFRLTNSGTTDAKSMPVALRVNGNIVAQDTFDVPAGKTVLAALQWQKASGAGSEIRSALGDRLKAELVIDPSNSTALQAAASARVLQVANLVIAGTPAQSGGARNLQRAMLQVNDGGCAGLRFDSGPTGTCDSGDIAIEVEDLGNGRFRLNANNGVTDLGSGTVAAQNFSTLPFSPNAVAVAGHTYAVQLRNGAVGQLTIQSIRNPHRLTVRSGKLFRGGQAASKVKTLGGSTDAPQPGDTSGGQTRTENSVYFDVLFGSAAN